MFAEYFFIFEYFFFTFLLVLFLFGISFFLVVQAPDPEKISVYECGFNPYSDARNKFEVKFYLVAILFIIFDLELTFLFPWVVCLNAINPVGIYGMILFIFILSVGFCYELFSGALDWH